jgi:hypothetical protein
LTKNSYFKRYCFVILFVTAFIFTLLAVSKPFAKEKSQYPNKERQMNYQQGFQSPSQISSKLSSNEHQILHLYADEFHFEAHVDFPSSVLTKPDKYAESITHDNNGALDMTLLNQGNTIKYLFQVSSIPKQQCQSDTTRACQQGADAPARGNVAEIQITLPESKLMPGTYTFGKGGSTLTEDVIEDVIIYFRQLYSDPSHGKLGCQAWGAGALNVKKAVYNVNGKLEYLEASLFRLCDRTAPFPPTRPEDNLLQVEVENIEKYTYHASWRSHMKVAGEGSR